MFTIEIIITAVYFNIKPIYCLFCLSVKSMQCLDCLLNTYHVHYLSVSTHKHVHATQAEVWESS